MKVAVEGKALKAALTVNKHAVYTRGLAVLAGAKITAAGDKLTITTTDLDQVIVTTVPATVYAGGVTVAPVKLILDLLRKPQGSVELNLADDGESLQVLNGCSASLRTLLTEDFPRDPAIPSGGASYPLDLAALAKVLPAIATDDNRPMLTGVKFGDNELVATDSYRLHLAKVSQHYPSLLVPGKPLLPIVKAGGQAVMYVPPNADRVVITTAQGSWHLRLIEGSFPNYRQLIPQTWPCEVVYDRSAVLTALEHVRAVKRESTTPVRLHFEDRVTRFELATQDLGSVSMSVPYEFNGPPNVQVVAFNPEYLAESIKVGTTDRVRIKLIDALKPAGLTDDPDDGSLRLLMPVRIP